MGVRNKVCGLSVIHKGGSLPPPPYLFSIPPEIKNKRCVCFTDQGAAIVPWFHTAQPAARSVQHHLPAAPGTGEGRVGRPWTHTRLAAVCLGIAVVHVQKTPTGSELEALGAQGLGRKLFNLFFFFPGEG